MSRYLYLIVLVIVCLGAWIYQREYSFQLSKVYSDLDYHPEWESTLAPDIETYRDSLSQPLRFLGRGAQFYAF